MGYDENETTPIAKISEAKITMFLIFVLLPHNCLCIIGEYSGLQVPVILSAPKGIINPPGGFKLGTLGSSFP
jgi:hypothetical protein